MDKKLHELLDTIKFPLGDYEKLKDAHLKRVKVNNRQMKIVLKTDNILDIKTYLKLNQALDSFFNVNCLLEIEPDHINYRNLNDYYDFVVSELEIQIIGNRLREMYGNHYILALNESEKRQFENSLLLINERLSLYGFPKLEVVIDDYEREKISKEINKDLKVEVLKPVSDYNSSNSNNTFSYKDRQKRVQTVDDPCVLLGEIIKDESRFINDIVGEDNDLVIDAEVFGCEGFESSKSDFKIVTLKVTDYTDSIYVKVFTKDKDEYEKYLKNFKNGKWFKFKGYTKHDTFAQGALVFNCQSINFSDHKKEVIVDDAPSKRVELHVHTMMSQMDGVTGLDLGKE